MELKKVVCRDMNYSVQVIVKMVVLHVKRGPSSMFLYKTTVGSPVDGVVEDVAKIYNTILKIKRIALETEELASHGPALPGNMVGLLEEQLAELNLKDELGEACVPKSGTVYRKDPLLKRNGHAPIDEDAEYLKKAAAEAVNMVSLEQLNNNVCLTPRKVEIAVEVIKGCLDLIYPTGLPDYDPIREALEDREDLRGTSHENEVLRNDEAELWFAGKKWATKQGKKVGDYVGKNEKCKVIVKLQKAGSGPPARDIGLSFEEKKQLMLAGYKRQEELKKLEEDKDLNYLNSSYSDPQSLKRAFHGLDNIKFRPK